MPLIEPASQGNHLYPGCGRTPDCSTSAVDTQGAFGNSLSGMLLLCSRMCPKDPNQSILLDENQYKFGDKPVSDIANDMSHLIKCVE